MEISLLPLRHTSDQFPDTLVGGGVNIYSAELDSDEQQTWQYPVQVLSGGPFASEPQPFSSAQFFVLLEAIWH
jgi:hypothetical protein